MGSKRIDMYNVRECVHECVYACVWDIISVISARTFSHTFSHSQLRVPCYPHCAWSKPTPTTSRLQPKFLWRSRGVEEEDIHRPRLIIQNASKWSSQWLKFQTHTRMTIAATTITTTIAGRLIEESQIRNTINKATRPVEGHSHAPPQLLLRSTGSCPK